MRSLKDYGILSLKGMAMGAADVVPGVSGGTIAFISGIYEELLSSISSVNLGTLKVLRKEGIAVAWKSINGNFLLALILGIGISVVSLAKLITFLMEEYPVQLWSFFFGLIIASILFVGKQVKNWEVKSIAGIVAGTAIAFYITVLPPMSSGGETWFIFIAGAIAICAMILPGISGSFILLLLGAYQTILGAISDKDVAILGVFAAGCITGLLAFSRLLNWMFKNLHDLTVAILTGFLIGSLNKIWPWKITTDWRVNSHDELVPFIQVNAWPESSEVLVASLIAVAGFAVIFLLERLAVDKN